VHDRGRTRRPRGQVQRREEGDARPADHAARVTRDPGSGSVSQETGAGPMRDSLCRALVVASVVLVIPACTRSTSPDGGGEPMPGPPVGTNQPPLVRLTSPSP